MIDICAMLVIRQAQYRYSMCLLPTHIQDNLVNSSQNLCVQLPKKSLVPQKALSTYSCVMKQWQL